MIFGRSKLRDFAIILTLSVVACALVAFVELSIECNLAASATPASERCRILKVPYDWQNLLAGLFAIGAALIGAKYLQRQILLADEHEKERNRRMNAAARAMLPLALSHWSQYAHDCARLLRGVHRQASGEAVPREALAALALPALPSAATTDMRAMVESSDQLTGKPIAAMLSCVQVQASRLMGIRSEGRDLDDAVGVVALSYLEDIVINTAEVYARCAALFDFARGETDEVAANEPSAQQLHSALRNLGFHSGYYDRIYETISRRANSSRSE